jgi:hypothetical protein
VGTKSPCNSITRARKFARGAGQYYICSHPLPGTEELADLIDALAAAIGGGAVLEAQRGGVAWLDATMILLDGSDPAANPGDARPPVPVSQRWPKGKRDDPRCSPLRHLPYGLLGLFEEDLGGGQVPRLAQSGIASVACLINGSVEVAPLIFPLPIGLIDVSELAHLALTVRAQFLGEPRG